MPNSRDKRLIVALVYDDLCTFEFGVVSEVFALPRPEMGADWYRFATSAEQKGPVRAGGGIWVQAGAGLAAMNRAGTIVIPGWGSDRPPCSPALRRALLRAHKEGARLVTICSGAFLLAELGILDGRRATTHWRYSDTMRRRFPQVDLAPDVLYVDDGNVLTSAGSAAGIDLLLHVVRSDFGPTAANKVARRLVVAPHRSGGQRQFIEAPVPPQHNERLSILFDCVRASPARRWSLNDMARASAMSARTFSRRFRELTGLSPGEWLIQERIAFARRLLESKRANLGEIAEAVGLGGPENLIRQFRRRVGVTPQSYRRTFSTADR